MRHLISGEVTQSRIAKWMAQAKSISNEVSWTETRLAITLGKHTYLVVNNQIFQCAHCGHYDPEWSATEVLHFIEETLGIKPHEIEVTCTVASSS